MLLKVGLVGTGNMGRHYANKFKLLGFDTTLIDIDSEKLKNFDNDYYKKYTDFEEALNKEEFDWIFIVTSPKLHIPLAKKAIERNINVMIEKPPAINPAELEEAIQLAEKNKVYIEVSEIELQSNNVRNYEKRELVHEVESYRLNLGRGYINPFYDLAWHDLYIFQYLFGNLSLKKVVDNGDIVDVYGETSENEFFLQVAWSQKSLRREWILKTKNGNIIFDFVNDKTIYPEGKIKEKDNLDKLESMIKKVINNPSFESSYRALEILKEFNKFNIKEK
jgi:predicted dehydrogenase